MGIVLVLTATTAWGQVDGTVFRDYSADGIQDALEPGAPLITVTAFLAGGGTVATMTAADGTYSFTAVQVPAATDVRLELTGLPAYLQPGPFGTDSGTTAVFVTAPATTVDVGLNNPAHYCDDFPSEAVTACYVAGDQSGTDPIVVSFPEDAGSASTVSSAAYDLPAYTSEAVSNEVGTVWGLDYRSKTNVVYAGALVKRHADLGSTSNPTTIYEIDRTGGTVSTWITLDGARADPHSGGVDGWPADFDAFDDVFKEGLGDIDISEDEDTLYTVDLGTRDFVTIAINADGSAGTVTRVPIVPAAGTVETDLLGDGCGANSDIRPFGLGVNDGTVYLGIVCSAQSSVDEAMDLPIEGPIVAETITRPGDRTELRGYVYTWNGATDFTQVVNFPFNYDRGCALFNTVGTCDDALSGLWVPWVDTYPFFNRSGSSPSRHTGIYPQPAISDIEFTNNEMIIGVADRWGHQTGPKTETPAYPGNPGGGIGLLNGDFSSGDMLRACSTGPGAWVMEELISGDMSCGTAGTSPAANATRTIDEFYFNDDQLSSAGLGTDVQHSETPLGGLTQFRGRADIVASVYDPNRGTGDVDDGGIGWHNNSTGGWTRGYRLFDGVFTAGDPFFGKAAGVADVSPMCPPAPLEIGNRVWCDANNDGVQDPDVTTEPGAASVDVVLTCGTDAPVTATTDANGQYLFTDASYMAVNGTIIPRETPCTVSIDTAGANGTDITSACGGIIFAPTNMGGVDAGADLRDSDGADAGGGVTSVAITTGDYGDNNHTYDFGFNAVPPVVEDWGDAPDPTYPTLAASNGPRHIILAANNPTLGAAVDAESDGQPSATHNGDDSNGVPDDEDGVTLPASFVGGSTVNVPVTASGAGGTLDFFIDWDGNGTFGNNANEIYSDTLAVGANMVSVAVPAGATAGTTCARFRYSTAGGLGATGAAANGEVEDYEVTVVVPEDWGDAPDPTYPTLSASNGPRHIILASNNPTLGAEVDAETDGQPSADHTGDDSNGTPDDEDGVTLPAEFVGGSTVDVPVTASGAGGTLDFFIDWDSDGAFGNNANEIYSDTLAVGANMVSVAVPAGATAGTTCARFRYSTAGGLGATGAAPNGEVEDYEVTVVVPEDWGDAPDPTYPTLSASNGPRHIILASNNPTLGAEVDAETDGQPSADHTGDDSNGTPDDEDGVTLPAEFVGGSTVDVPVTASGAGGTLDFFIDWDGDGAFGSNANEIYSDTLAVGANMVSVAVPAGATAGTTCARFRYSTAGGLGATGAAPNGEVEDYEVTVVAPEDWGDAPDPTYPTLSASNGPRHIILASNNPTLGAEVDAEADGQPSADHTGDDSNGTPDDEDGVTLPAEFVGGSTVDVPVTASGAGGTLDFFIDWDGDGAFGNNANEIYSDTLAVGANMVSVAVPAGATAGTTCARFRYSTAGGLGATGAAPNGEVEDYEVTVVAPEDWGDAPDPTYPTLSASNGPRHVILASNNPTLGAAVDAESDGQPSADHTGDDANGTPDDEDGVTLPSSFIGGDTVDVPVTASGAGGTLDFFIDWDGDGTFGNNANEIYSDTLAVGANMVSVAVPVDATAGTTCARFRYSTAGSLGATGAALDGEVEDYEVTVADPRDYGDAPDTYGTTSVANHVIVTGFSLGVSNDSDVAGQPSPGADGDDTDGNDDEDGITFAGGLAMAGACSTGNSLDVTLDNTAALATALLDAWIDFDGNGVFDDPAEHLFGGTSAVLGPASGVTTLTYDVPCDAVPQVVSYARFRLSSAGGSTPTDMAADGEVEDYVFQVKGVDFGDAPDTYGTTLAANGPSHTIIPGYSLGAAEDTEPDGQPSAGADGDDTDGGGDDEDGVVLVGGMASACATNNALEVTLTNTAGIGAALLDAWADFDGDGTFDDPAEHLFGGTSAPLTAGLNNLTYDVPCDAVPQATTYARFRLSSSGGLAPTDAAGTGPVSDGEVEDYLVQVKGVDYGDAPDTYGTTMAADGPSHTIIPGYSLGANEDTESDGQPSPGADGDDTDSGGDDEDGVVFAGGMAMAPACSTGNGLDVTLTDTAGIGVALLDAWIDFDGDGTFDDPAEHLFGGTSAVLAVGVNALTYDVPCNAASGDVYARFRLSSAGGLAPTDPAGSGPAADGEVEDYTFQIKGLDFGDAPETEGYPTLFASDGARHIILPLANPVLGAVVDGEPDGQPDINHLGDDQAGAPDDEDGVVFAGVLIPGTTSTVDVTAGATGGNLSAWIDFDRNGVWSAGEQIAVDMALAANTTTSIDVMVPVTAVDGASCGRFRFSSQTGLTPTGLAADGEIEDHAVAIGTEDPSIGIAKELIAVTEVTQSEFVALFRMTVTNFGNVALSDIQAVADLADAFADAESFAVDSLTSSEFTVNAGFDGMGDTNLLAGTDTLDVGATGFIELEVLIVPGTNPGPYFCSSIAMGTSPNDVEVSDVSQEGDDPDPDGMGDPTDNEEPTVVRFSLPVIDIPTLGMGGMTLLVLALSTLGLSVLRRRRRS